MLWRITGIDGSTGSEREIVVEADNERDALLLAKEQDLYPTNAVRDKHAEDLEAGRKRIAELEAQQLTVKQEEERRRDQGVRKVKEAMRQRLAEGRPVFLYDSLYIPVDSVLLDEKLAAGFHIDKLRRLGLFGWEVLEIVPRTIGVGLKNSSVGSTYGTTWGGGSGGNVAGVYVILKRQVHLDEITDEPKDEISRIVRRHLADYLGN